MPNASDFGFAIDGQLPSTEPAEDWRTISNAVFASKARRASLPETAISQDLVSLLATNLGVTQIDAAPLVEVINFERGRMAKGETKADLARRFRVWINLPLILTARIIGEIDRIETLIAKGKALREGCYWTYSFAVFPGKRARITVENGDYPTYDTVDWQNKQAADGAAMTGGQHFIGSRSEAVAKAASVLTVDHYEIEVIG